ncbi:MAG: hypothetical protein HY812_13730 [Planctomycetes bacterium]|nr:hypothetical protein [Planctomycetota bacterium]
MKRREFLQAAAAGCAACLASRSLLAGWRAPKGPGLVSPGCRTSKVKIAKLYLGIPNAMWPTPKMDLAEEVKRYEGEFARMGKDFADVDFIVNETVTDASGVALLAAALKDADGILAIHLSMGVSAALQAILAANKPTVLFAAPYSGHEWTSCGALRKSNTHLDVILSSDLNDLARAVRPIRCIHHLRAAKICDITAYPPDEAYVRAVADKFGTKIQVVDLQQVLDAYEAVDPVASEHEAQVWIAGAERVVEPPQDEILRSCRLALAFETLLEAEGGTVLTADCYGSMYRKLPAFPCVGFVRLNDMGLGGCCESDLDCCLTHVLIQGLTGKPGFISDPTMDESKNAIILAHCLGSRKMDGPDGEMAPYLLRTIMERQEGCVPQVRMRAGQRVTQLITVGTDTIRFFTGTVLEAPDGERGCRTKIAVQIDGDAEKLWLNWSAGLHRQTVYGDIRNDLERVCRLMGITLIDEAA